MSRLNYPIPSVGSDEPVSIFIGTIRGDGSWQIDIAIVDNI